MAREELGRALHHEIDTVPERAAVIRSRECVVGQHQRAIFVGGTCQRRQVYHAQPRIRDCLDEQQARAACERALRGGKVGGIDIRGCDPKTRKVIEQANRVAVQLARCYDSVARAQDRQER